VSALPDTHHAIPSRDAPDTDPAQVRTVGLHAASHVIRHGLSDDALRELLEAVGAIPTVSGARTSGMGKRIAKSPRAAPRT
jgi:hypothetical protein